MESSSLKTVKTTLNRLMKEWSYNRRKNVCPAHPSVFAIETTNFCNLNCVMCPTGVMKRKRGFIEFSVVKKIVDECKDYTSFVWLQNFGEPLLHPRLFDMIRYCKEKGVNVGFSTNATLLNSDVGKRILSSGLDQIILSFDGCTQETYEKIRRGAEFETVRRNILSFLAMKKRMQSRHPITILQIIRMKDTENDVKEFFDLWKAAGSDQVIVKGFDTWAGQVESIKKLAEMNHYGEHCGSGEDARHACFALWDSMVILWDGTVVPCCEDFDGRMILGNVKKSSIAEIWNGVAMLKLRNKHIHSDFDNVSLCRMCNEYRGSPPNSFWPIDQNLCRKFSLFLKLLLSGKIAPSVLRS